MDLGLGLDQKNMNENYEALRASLLDLPRIAFAKVENSLNLDAGTSANVTTTSGQQGSLLSGGESGLKQIFTIGESDSIFHIGQYYSKIFICVDGQARYPIGESARFRIQLFGKNVTAGETTFTVSDNPSFTLGPPNQYSVESQVIGMGAPSTYLEILNFSGSWVLTDVYEGDQIKLTLDSLQGTQTNRKITFTVYAYY